MARLKRPAGDAEAEQRPAAGAAIDAGRPTRADAQRLLDLLSAAHSRPVTFALARASQRPPP
jgi:hypothetical protein